MTPTPDKPAGEALKACPFCGGKAFLFDASRTTREYWAVPCPNELHCALCPETDYMVTKEEALDAWNRRTPPPSVLDDEWLSKGLSELERLIPEWVGKFREVNLETNSTAQSLARQVGIALLTRLKDSSK